MTMTMTSLNHVVLISVFIAKFKQISHIVIVLPLLTVNKQNQRGSTQ